MPPHLPRGPVPPVTGAPATAVPATGAPGDSCPMGDNCPRATHTLVTAPGPSGRGNFVRVAHASPTKNFGGEMLTWVWLARASPELTKPKSTFAAPKIFCGR